MKNKILIFTVSLLSSFANCLAVDGLGFNNTYKGDEAKKKIIAAAKIGDFLTANAAFSAQGHTGSDLLSLTISDVILASLIDEAVIHIDSSKFYKKTEVDLCAKNIASLGVLTDFDSFTTFASNPACRLNPDNEIVDINFGSGSK